MKNPLIGKIAKSMIRIVIALAVILGIPAICYLFWQPGSDTPLPEYRSNAIWIGHGWLGDDSWMQRNQRRKEDFRSPEKISALMKKLSENHISIVYPHLCPAQYNGKIAPYDSAQVERFLDLAEKFHIKVIPWIGGVLDESARISDPDWRKNFVESAAELLTKHPRLSGVQINIEPLPSENFDFLRIIDALRPLMQGKILSVAAYPPPTRWHPFPNVHWRTPYIDRIARHCDQLAVMMYDTAIPLEKFYTDLMTRWTIILTGTMHLTGCELILGIPAYEDAGVGYHHPRVENISSALRGISASGRTEKIGGIAIYCEWEMNEAKWEQWRRFTAMKR